MRALDGVSLTIAAGGAFGLLGPNGAGKTTLLKILAGLVTPNAGSVTVSGIDAIRHPGRTRDVLMYVSGEERSLYWRLTGRDNLTFYAHLVEVPARRVEARVGEVLAIVGLEDKADEQVMRYSSGMKHRLAIARGLLSDPEILLLDEPTRSLDPLSARRLWNFIKDVVIGQHGRSVVIATHNMEEAAYLCSRVAILHNGRVRACDTVDRVSAMLETGRRCTVKVEAVTPEAIGAAISGPGIRAVSVEPPNGKVEYSLSFTVDDPALAVPRVVELLVRAGGRVTHVGQESRSLTDVIVALAERNN
jgi:ABC-2 type transport system ATP-binding protein